MNRSTKVTLREKPISGQRSSLYLDFFPPLKNPKNGTETRREFLDIYVPSEYKQSEGDYLNADGIEKKGFVVLGGKTGRQKRRLTDTEKSERAELLATAQAKASQRRIDIKNRHFGFLTDESQSADFVEYFQKLTNARKGSTFENWSSSLDRFKKFAGEVVTIGSLDDKLCREFREDLLKDKKLNINTKSLYLTKFKTALKTAFKEDFIPKDLNKKVDPIKTKDSTREYLTSEELQRAMNTESKYPELKKAAIFSALTGLRGCDIEKLKWSEVHNSRDAGHYLDFKQQKGGRPLTLPIPEIAFKMIGKKGNTDDLVFPGLHKVHKASKNLRLRKWMQDASITKHLSFHCLRHTYATLQLERGTDLYTVSKNLGHVEISTTQIYAKVRDAAKKKAAERMNDFDMSNI